MRATKGRARWWGLLAMAGLLVAAACASGPAAPPIAAPLPAPSTQALPSPPPPSPSASPSSTASPEPAEPVFRGSAARIDDATRAGMASSWHEGCPVPLEDLRLLTLDFWGFDGKVHSGEMVVHRDLAQDVVGVFRELFGARFPIRRMRLVDDYGGDDDRSMAANNTSAFNCRPVTGGSAWSEHSYGRAIDINPIQNPYVTEGGTVLPPGGAAYVDRSLHAKGMIHAGDAVVRAFTSVGWRWGGSWADPTDYQHFSSSGR